MCYFCVSYIKVHSGLSAINYHEAAKWKQIPLQLQKVGCGLDQDANIHQSLTLVVVFAELNLICKATKDLGLRNQDSWGGTGCLSFLSICCPEASSFHEGLSSWERKELWYSGSTSRSQAGEFEAQPGHYWIKFCHLWWQKIGKRDRIKVMRIKCL